jgi:uncharacterized membrane protein YccC
MQKQVIAVNLADNPKEVSQKIKKSIESSDEVATRIQRIAAEVGNYALQINNALKVLDQAKSAARLGRMQSEKAKQKDAAKQWGKLEDQASSAIAKYGKLANAVKVLDRAL